MVSKLGSHSGGPRFCFSPSPGVDFINCFAPYRDLLCLGQTFTPLKAFQKLGVWRNRFGAGCKQVYEIDSWMHIFSSFFFLPFSELQLGAEGCNHLFTKQLCSELVGCTRLNLQTDKFGLHFGLDYDLW